MAAEREWGQILVIGAGTMGGGIAQSALVAGYSVHLADTREDALLAYQKALRQRLESLFAKQKLKETPDSILSRLTKGQIEDAPNTILAIEAVAEIEAVKQSVFTQVAKLYPQAWLASNTSSLSINTIAAGLPDPSRLIGLHFFNPAPLMPLVEIVAGQFTDQAAIPFAQDFCEKLSKTAVLVRDSPGFIVNRVARPFYTETMRATLEDNLLFEEADAAMRAQGFKMGPYQLMDLIGLDINFHVTTQVWEGLGKPARFNLPILQQERVEKGNFGVKSGKGFYAYPS